MCLVGSAGERAVLNTQLDSCTASQLDICTPSSVKQGVHLLVSSTATYVGCVWTEYQILQVMPFYWPNYNHLPSTVCGPTADVNNCRRNNNVVPF